MEGQARGNIALHFDGDIVTDHKVTARTLGKALLHTQNAIDRAYLDTKYGNLWKHARMKSEDYAEADFIALYPEEGSLLQGLVSLSFSGVVIADRIRTAVRPAMERAMAQGEENASSLKDQYASRKNQIQHGIIEPQTYEQFVQHPDARVVRSYADRSINRELDQTLSMIRAKHAGESTLGITVGGNQTETYEFNKATSENFHRVISKRELGQPVIYRCNIRQLDNVLLNGKAINEVNERTVTLHFFSNEDFLKAHPYLANNQPMTFLGSPLIEYGAYDPNAGDVYFIDLV